MDSVLKGDISPTQYDLFNGLENSNLRVDIANGIIAWNYEKNIIEREILGLKAATVLDEKTIYIKNIDKDGAMQIQYYSIEGNFVFSYIKNSGEVCWKSNFDIKSICVNKLISAEFYSDAKVIICMYGEKRGKCILSIYNIEGELEKHISQPDNYYFSYLSIYKNIATVVCQGDETTADEFGRRDWKFTIDLQNGKLIPMSLAY